MKIDLEIRWKTTGREAQEFDPRLFMLLKSIRSEGSLQSAATLTGVSYRHAWGLLRDWGNRFGMPVAELERGRGTKLTALGEKLLWAEQEIQSRFATGLASAAADLNKELYTIVHPRHRSKKIRMYASNDLAITHLLKLSNESGGINLDLQFHGSLESLRLLAGDHCDVAGFHFPAGELSMSLVPMYRKWINEDKNQLILVAKRQQGLMTRADNPHRIRQLRDLTKRSVCFVNRQRESGTRTILDELLKQGKINSRNIRGYLNEEFTHVAVAAMVASGAVDAGFGIQAAADKFGLNFIPVVEENYALAVNRDKSSEVINALKGILRSKPFQDEINSLPGYNAQYAGNEMTVHEFFL
ncbi:MAG: hypothetical protein A2W28_12985 [Gammaproteobacteria bacterium RBG_16_51_14]|nr:MAG: hypothetical protein A2W28_12985 [Gammaproteobacteria bacterium RBG_16_51_14]